MPEVSVIIPTYNRANLLPRTIKSVLNQTYQDFEIIIVDDASTDNTKEIVYGFHDDRIGYVKLSKNSGSSSRPRNIGLSGARGKFIAFLDSDDEWLPTFLARLVDRINQSLDTVGLVYCGLIVESSDGRSPYIVHNKQRGKVWPRTLEICVSSTTSSLIKKECFDRAGLFDDSDKRYDHWDMWIRLSKHCEFEYIPEALAQYNCHISQKSRMDEALRMKAILERYRVDYAQHPMQAGIAQLRLGLVYMKEGNKKESLKYIIPNLKYALRVFSDFRHTHQTLSGSSFNPMVSTLLETTFRRRR